MTMTLCSNPTVQFRYPFLANPLLQEECPVQPLPSPPASAAQTTYAAIANWAARVQPGSPTASPQPRCRSFYRKRRPSIVSIRVPPTSSLHIAPTPTTAHLSTTPSCREFKADLTSVGYTAVFLQLPHTPLSATLALSVKPSTPNAVQDIPISPIRQPRSPIRLRSLSCLRFRRRSRSACPASPSKMLRPRPTDPATPATIAKRKRSKYPMRPPPLAMDIAAMQLLDGGSMDHNIKRAMEAQSKATGAMGISEAYRDSQGILWRDREEQLEYTHLLAEGAGDRESVSDEPWVTFDPNAPSGKSDIPWGGHRDSVLDPAHFGRPVDLPDGNHFPSFGGAAGLVAPTAMHEPATSVLAIPARANRTAQHLQKAEYLVNAPAPRYDAFNYPVLPDGMDLGLDTSCQSFGSNFQPMVGAPSNPVIPRAGGPLGNHRANNGGPTNMPLKKLPAMLPMKGLFRPARKEDVMPGH